jgi:superfamily I DNA/RNA helicase
MERLLAASQERKGSVFAAMLNPTVQFTFNTASRQRIEEFVNWVQKTRSVLQAAAGLPLRNWAEGFLTEIGYVDELRRSEKTAEAAESRIRNLKDLLAGLDDQPAQMLPCDRLQGFLEDLTLDEDRAEEKERKGEAVTLITMHSCKGLEFPHVYIVGLEEGLLPHSRSKLEGTLDEERRLFYVAITRAMQSLRISYCLTRKKYGQSLTCHPSVFLKELPDHLVDRADAKASQVVTTETGKSFFDNLRASLS